MRGLAVALAVGLSLSVSPAAADVDLVTWGYNAYGQVGDGTVIDQSSPVVAQTAPIAGKRITAVGAGQDQSCAVAEGTVYCWGYNGDGQIGDGTRTDRPVPTLITGDVAGRTATAVTGGERHTCALADGAVFCWGNNIHGQLGVGDTTDRLTPTRVQGVLAGKNVTAIAAGGFHTCAVAEQRLYCWGQNKFGEVGDGTSDQRDTPVRIDALPGAVSAATTGMFHTCALADTRAYCWGYNASGQLGLGLGSPSAVPVPTAVGGPVAGRVVSAITAGESFTCALGDGAVGCWGANGQGQLGDGTTNPNPSPPDAPVDLGGRRVSSVSAGASSVCVTADGSPYCWGANWAGQLGIGTTDSSPVPKLVAGVGDMAVRSLISGGNHVLLLPAQAPLTPRSVSARAAAGAVALSWQASADDGGRPVTYVVGGSGTCETTGLGCTVEGLAPGGTYVFTVAARNVEGSSPAAVVQATLAKLRQKGPKPPKKLKKDGVTVLTKKGARTSAGVPVETRVSGNPERGGTRLFKVIRKKGAVTVRTYGEKPWRLVLKQSAPGTATHEPWSQRTVYVNGKRR